MLCPINVFFRQIREKFDSFFVLNSLQNKSTKLNAFWNVLEVSSSAWASWGQARSRRTEGQTSASLSVKLVHVCNLRFGAVFTRELLKATEAEQRKLWVHEMWLKGNSESRFSVARVCLQVAETNLLAQRNSDSTEFGADSLCCVSCLSFCFCYNIGEYVFNCSKPLSQGFEMFFRCF